MIRALTVAVCLSAASGIMGCTSSRMDPVENRAVEPPAELRERFAAAVASPGVLALSLSRAEAVPGGLAVWISLSGQSLTRVVHRDRVLYAQSLIEFLRVYPSFEVLDSSGQVVESQTATMPLWMSREFERDARSRPLFASLATSYSGDFEHPPMKSRQDGVLSQQFYISCGRVQPGFTVRFAHDAETGNLAIVDALERYREFYGGFESAEVLNRQVRVEPSSGP